MQLFVPGGGARFVLTRDVSPLAAAGVLRPRLRIWSSDDRSVCGMTVEPASAAGSHTHAGQTYYFCSRHCLDRRRSVAVHARRRRRPRNRWCRPRPRPAASGRARCIPRSCATGRAPARSAAWRWSRASRPPRTTPNPELADMTRRFWVSAVVDRAAARAGDGRACCRRCATLVPAGVRSWIELALATPVVLWGGWPFFVRVRDSIANRSPNMFTLIGLGVAVAYAYSLVAVLAPGLFPPRSADTTAASAVYFEPAAVIVTLVLLGQVLELRARGRTGAAIRALLKLAPKRGAARSCRWRRRRRAARRRPRGRSAARPSRRTASPSTASSRRARAPSTNRWSPASRCPSAKRAGDRVIGATSTAPAPW